MDRNVLDVIERELDDEVRTRFPGAAVRHVALLQYGDDPQIEPRDLWVRVLLDSDGPEDYDRSWKAFADAHQAAIDEFPRYLTEKVHEIMNVEFRFADSTEVRLRPRRPPVGLPHRAAAVGLPGVGARRGHLRARPDGPGRPGNAGHADHGGHRGHPHGGHPLGPGPFPRPSGL